MTNGTFTGPGNRDLYLEIDSQTIRSQSGDPNLVIVDTEGFPLGIAGGWPPLTIEGIQFRNSIAFAEWDGADDSGRDVPGGVYYLRDGAGAGTRRSSVVMLR